MKKLFLTILLIICIPLISCKENEHALENPSINAADDAYMKLDLKLSRKILNLVLENNASTVEEKVNALQRLAIQDWKFYQNYDEAKKRLSLADSLGRKRSKTMQLLSRIEREAGYYPQAQAAANKALEYKPSLSDKVESEILIAHAIHDKSMTDFKKGSLLDKKSLTEGSDILKSLLSSEPGHAQSSKLLLGISFLLGDGPTALEAWRSYFHITKDQLLKGVLEKPAGVLADILPKWEGKDLSRSDRKLLSIALAKSRFFEYAVLLAFDPDSNKSNPIIEDHELQDILHYADFIGDVKQITNEYYRKISLGKQNEGKYKKQLWAKARELWTMLHFDGEKPEFSESNFKKEMSDRFGAEITTGGTGNYKGYVLIMGHRVIDETRSIEQYDYKADFRYILIDMMVSNGYSSWFWDGKSSIGGWGTDNTMLQIGEAYMNEPYGMWRMVSDPEERKATENFIKMRETIENSTATQNPDVKLDGLVKRLRYGAANRILNTLKSRGLSGSELCLAFIHEFEKYKLESTIFAHEGRHSIDQKYFPKEFKKWSMAEREFRAKISQIVFSFDPKLASSEILSGAIGDYGHGKANRRIRQAAIDWMNKHLNEIEEIDQNKSLLPQFYLLTDEQIRNCFKAVDPLAIKI